MRLAIIIPAYNEAKVIGRVIRAVPRSLPEVGKPTVLVVDDGSTDGTGRIAKRAGAQVLRHLLNRGKGVALSTGFKAAKILRASVAVTMDADGQHDPSEVAALIRPILRKEADIVIGSRLLTRNGRMPLERLLANKLSNALTKLLAKVTVTDSQSGFRAFSRRALEALDLSSRGFEVETEMLMQAKKKHLQIAEVPIKTIYTAYSRSKGQHFAHGIIMASRLVARVLKGNQ